MDSFYCRRTKMNPLWNTLVVGGFCEGKSFLGYIDKLGVAYEDGTIATGYGAHIAQVLFLFIVNDKFNIKMRIYFKH